MLKKSLILLAVIISIFGYLIFSAKPKVMNTPLNLTTLESTVILTGDIMLGRSVMSVSLAKKDPNYPFEKIVDTLKNADLVFGNLENPIIANCPKSDSGFKFCADPKMIQGLNYAGIDIVNLANNHTGNYGKDGIIQTENYLKNAGLNYVGTDNLIVKEVNGIKFGFLGFDFIDHQPRDSDYRLIKDSKKEVDVLMVMVHWGREYSPAPTKNQELIAKDLVSTGADVVVGSHPHWVQKTDYVDGRPIFYSLGNFVFDQPWSEETKNGLAIRLTYRDNKLLNIEKLPIYMKNFAQPEWVQ